MFKIDDEEEYSNAEANIGLQNQSAYDEISLSEKEIEPSQDVSGEFATRNLQLGNIDRNVFKFFSSKIDSALKLMNVPYAQGGFISIAIGESLMQEIDLSLILSNSVDGRLRQLRREFTTRIKKEKNKVKKAYNKGIERN